MTMRDVYLSDSEVAEFKTVNEKRNALRSLVDRKSVV